MTANARHACKKAAICVLHAVSHHSIRKGDEPPPARIYYGLPRTDPEPLSSLLYFFSQQRRHSLHERTYELMTAISPKYAFNIED